MLGRKTITRTFFVCALCGLFAEPGRAQGASAAELTTEPAISSDTNAAAPQPAAATPSAPEIRPPIALQPLTLDYPEQGDGNAVVVVELLVAVDGSVAERSVIQGQGVFADAASRAAEHWRFSPATRNGHPVPARIRVQVEFSPPVVEPATVEPAAGTVPAVPAPASSPAAPVVQPTVDVIVLGERPADVKRLSRAEVRQMPGAFGDPYRAIEALPGVTPIVSGLPYFFIRGAPPGNVGYFFDEVSIPLLYHVAVGPGVIHPAFIQSVDLYAGAYPAKYGRFAGGIVEGEAAEPTHQARGELSVRLLDSGGFVELPFAEGRGSAMLGGRYSYTGLVVSLLAPDASLGYWDYQARSSYILNPDDTISLFAFGSHDYFSADNNRGERVGFLDLTFHRLKASYQHLVDAHSQIEASLLGVMERTGVGDGVDLNNIGLGARLAYQNRIESDLTVRVGMDILGSRSDVDIAFGNDNQPRDNPSPAQANDPRQLAEPGFPDVVLQPVEDQVDQQNQTTTDQRLFSRDDLASGVWVEAVWHAAPRVTLTPGFRLDLYKTGSDRNWAPEPRLTARFDVHNKVSLVHTLGIAHQPPSFPIPIPGATPSASDGLQQAIQSSAGIEIQLPAKLSGSATFFQNITLNSTDVLGTASLQASNPSGNAFSDRTASHAYGLELYLKRSLTERIGGFVSYTLGRSERSVDLASGFSSFDRTHVLNFALAFDLGRRWRMGTRVVTYSGIPAQVAYAQAAHSPPRTPWYYRLDVRLEKRWLVGSQGAWWAFVAEAVNSTLNEEVLNTSCYAYGCSNESIGPVTIPSLGLEASF